MEDSPTSPTVGLLVGILFITTVLAGCIGGGGSAGGATPGDVTDDVQNDTSFNTTSIENKTKRSVIEVKNGTQFQANSTFHVHDYWGAKEKVSIIDGMTKQIDWASEFGDNGEVPGEIVFDVQKNKVNGRFVPNTVYPGTGKMDITLSWSSQGVPSEEIFLPTLCFNNPMTPPPISGQSPHCQDANNQMQRHVYTQSGETWTIEEDSTKPGLYLTSEGEDPPHSLKSNWRFAVYPVNRDWQGFHDEGVPPNVGTTEFTLTVTIHRGGEELPLDPPHFAFFEKGETEMTILKGAETTHVASFNNPNQPLRVWGGSAFGNQHNSGITDSPVVPPAAEELRITASCSVQSPHDLILRYHTSVDLYTDPWKDVATCSGGEITATIPVKPGEGDTPYAQQTQWEFALFRSANVPDNPSQRSEPMAQASFTIQSIVAVKEGTA